jgi:hypothetical protein
MLERRWYSTRWLTPHGLHASPGHGHPRNRPTYDRLPLLHNWLIDAGFEDITQFSYVLSYSPWPPDRYLKELGTFQAVDFMGLVCVRRCWVGGVEPSEVFQAVSSWLVFYIVTRLLGVGWFRTMEAGLMKLPRLDYDVFICRVDLCLMSFWPASRINLRFGVCC